jgi:CO/xanthine dehydrogenase FAD-binding subunit
LKPAPFRYARPQSLADALELLSAGDPDVKILAGGQSLVPMLNLRLLRPAVLVVGARGDAVESRHAVEIANAVEDALAPFGVTICELPITPERVWQWMRPRPG